MIRIWGRKSAFNVQKALWALGECNLAFERIDAGGEFGGLDDPAYRAMNPTGRIPTIDDDGFVLWESHTIVRYLAARYGPQGFWPADARARALAERWMDWMQATLQPDFMALFWGLVRTPAPARNWRRLDAVIERTAAHFELLDAQLRKQPFLGGDEFTIADIPAGTSLYRYFEMDEISRPGLPNVRAWYARLAQRPAYQAHVMVPFDELKGRTTF